MQLSPSHPIGSVFAPLIGRRAWLVRKGYGSFLTLEFGEPHLVVREATPDAPVKALRRPLVTVRGDWHLWIYVCRWRIEEAGKLLAHSESSDRAIERATRAVSGQALAAIAIEASEGGSVFTFELGTTLRTFPLVEDGQTANENWLLYAPDGNVLTYREDGSYSWGHGTTRPSDQIWHPTP